MGFYKFITFNEGLINFFKSDMDILIGTLFNLSSSLGEYCQPDGINPPVCAGEVFPLLLCSCLFLEGVFCNFLCIGLSPL